MKTILVATDFSPAAKNATDYAAALCKEFNAKLILFNTFMLPVPVSEIPFVMITADEMQRTSEDSIKKEAERVFNDAAIETEWIVRLGIPYDEIRDIEKEQNVDLIIMGMKGAGGINKLIGSTTTAVTRKSRKPVLAVPETFRFSPIKSITYAADFDFDTRLECFEPLLTLVRQFGSNLQIIHVQKEGHPLKADENAGKSRLEAIWSNLPHSYHTVENTKLEQGIRQFIEQQTTDILVLVAHRHNFLERLFGDHVTRGLTGTSEIPLLILQDKG